MIPEKNAEVKATHGLAFPVLSDAGNAYAKSLGLAFTLEAPLRAVYDQFGLSLPDFNGDESWQLPIPTRLIVDRDGRIMGIAANADYTVRPEPSELPALLA